MTPRGVLLRFVLAGLLFCIPEGLIFRTGFYPSHLEPQSTAGALQTVLRLEKERYRPGTPRVLSVGDSRMALLLRVADPMAAESGYFFDRIAEAGTHPRCWYYMLRDADPDARRYAAIVIPMPSYDDEDGENLADAEVDIHYLVPLLRIADAFDFSASFESWNLRGQALRAALFKGLAYKRDLWAWWDDPAGRKFRVNWDRRNAAWTQYDFVGASDSLDGLRVDWAARKVTQYPPSASAETRRMLDAELFRTPEHTGQRTAYLRHWLGRIVERYRGSPTRLIFYRLPRGPVVPPDVPPAQSGAVREIAARGQAILIDEHRFDELERPALFRDAVHLNETGCEQFTVAFVREVRKVLGPPRTN